jgi:hypothetical protein
MSQDFIMEHNIGWIKASYFEKDDNPNYQVFYQFDSLGRIIESTTSDDIITSWKYNDEDETIIKTTLNPDIGNKIIEFSKGWQNHLIIIYSSSGDSLYHKILYDTVSTFEGTFIEAYDVVYPERDTTYRQVFDMEGHLLRYEILSEIGQVLASYSYVYIDGKLDYTEYFEGDTFVYKEKFSYHEDSEMRKQRVSVPGDDMFSNEETRYVTIYLINDDGLLYEEVEYLGKEHTSTIGYNYEYFGSRKKEEEEN